MYDTDLLIEILIINARLKFLFGVRLNIEIVANTKSFTPKSNT